MADKTIEEQIRDHYQAGNGEWLIEKGKVKEARFLKAATERIQTLKQDSQQNWRMYRTVCDERNNLLKDIELREKAIAQREKLFNQRVQDHATWMNKLELFE